MQYADDAGDHKIAAARALVALGMVLDDLRLIAWADGEFNEDGESLSEDWEVAARAFLKGMRDHGWGKEDVNTLILALVRVRFENV
jgi:hypothetical protein